MKIGVVLFHKNIEEIYAIEWVKKCLSTIHNQTYKDINFYEIDYGSSDKRLVSDSIFFSIEKLNYADAMNFIISKAFDDGCDFVFNTNLDDYYSLNRIEKQLEYLEMGFDIVSSNFQYINEKSEITRYLNMTGCGDILGNLNINNNVIAHPVVAISKNFWKDKNNRYDVLKTPEEDLDLWKRSINNGYKFHIIDEVLLYYRIHNNQVSYKKIKSYK
jgi:hypothetical protein